MTPAGTRPRTWAPRATRPLDHLAAVEAAIQEQQHARADAAQQAERAEALAGVAGPEAGIDDGVGPALGQVDALHLREGAVPRSL